MRLCFQSLVVFTVAAAVLLVRCAAQADPGPRQPAKKFIQLGWDMPTTAYLRANWQQMEKDPLFDGVIYQLWADAQGDAVSTEAFWDARPWKREWFAQAIADLRSCKFATLTDNFVRVNATPGSLDWYDDSAWEVLAEKAGIVAWAVREGGQKGICLDFESYGEPQFQFDPSKGHTFAETLAVARRRGAQFMRAIAAECPEAVLLTLWLNSANLAAGAMDDPAAILVSSNQGLLPAFVDGMLDALPQSMILVDGCENAYRYDSAEDYLYAFNAIRQSNGPAARLVSGENRPKYRGQVQAGFGFYLDAYVNPETSPWYIGGHGGSRLARLRQNLQHARQVCDEYVWVYGEQYRWWPRGYSDPSASRGKMWEDAMPGLSRAIRWAHDLGAAAELEVAARREAGTLINLAANPGFQNGVAPDSVLPVAYGAWQDDASHGTFSLDRTVGRDSSASGKMSGVRDGCFIQSFTVKPGEAYAVAAECLTSGTSVCTLVVRWQDPEGRWACMDRDSVSTFAPTRSGWARCFNAVVVPEGAGRLVLLLAANNQITSEDACWFDNIGVYKLSE